jgi:hypothetical protein
MRKNCWCKGKKRKNKDSHDDKSKKEKEQTHETQEETKPKENATYSMQEPEVIGFIEEVTFKNTKDYNYNTYNSSDIYANDKRLSYYDWLADTATTLHVTNSWDAFATFHTIERTAVTGVGSVKAQDQGRGIVYLKSTMNGQTYILKLEDVLYIPTNKHNLISLGCWDKASGWYMGGGGKISLITKNGKHVAIGQQINNNLYKIDITTYHCNNKSFTTLTTFIAEEPARSWDIWHK